MGTLATGGLQPKSCMERRSHTYDWAPHTTMATAASNPKDCPGTTRARTAHAKDITGTDKYLSDTRDCLGTARTSTAHDMGTKGTTRYLTNQIAQNCSGTTSTRTVHATGIEGTDKYLNDQTPELHTQAS